MKKSNDTIGNQSRNIPVCSELPQPLCHRVLPLTVCTWVKKFHYSKYRNIKNNTANKFPLPYVKLDQGHVRTL
jgi:hypothetical protein